MSTTTTSVMGKASMMEGKIKQDGAEHDALPAFLLDKNGEDDNSNEDADDQPVIEGIDVAAGTGVQKTAQRREHRRLLCREVLFFVTLISLIVTLVVVVVVRVAANKRQDRFVTPPPESPPPARSVSSVEPTLTPTHHYQTEVFDLLLTVSSYQDLTDPESPQHRAWHFIVEENIQKETRNSNVTSIFHRQQRPHDSKLIQRYILVVMYYALKLDQHYCTRFDNICRKTTRYLGNGIDECEWEGITCQLPQVATLEGRAGEEQGDPPSMATHGQVTVIELIAYEKSTEAVGRILPPEVGRLSELRILALDGMGIQGTIPPSLGDGARHLQILWLQENFMVGPLPTTFRSHPQLHTIVLSSNPTFGGTIPKMISTLLQLTEFSAFDCNVTGTLPTELGALKLLSHLNLRRNAMRGPIPSELATLPNLQHLLLAENQLSGTLHSSLYEGWGVLRSLVLSRNRLSGPLLVEKSAHVPFSDRRARGLVAWGGLGHGRVVVDLADNQFSGTISPSFANISNLAFLYLHGNNLTGTMPKEVCHLFQGDNLWSALQNLTADCEVQCSCCTHCVN